MKSPFPGMDPYIEARGLWGDFHVNIIVDIKRSLIEMVPDRYLVRIKEREYYVLGGQKGTIAEEHREAFVEISEAVSGQLVTCIEVLSPSNKLPDSLGRNLYLQQRQSLFLNNINLVEIDLLRDGERMPMLDPWPSSPYMLLVGQAMKNKHCHVCPATFRKRLPTIPVPLAKPDPELRLDLQPIIDGIYESSRYYRSIDYSKPLSPPLSPEDSAWLKDRLQG